MNTIRGPLVVLHAIFATVIVIALLAHLAERDHDAARIKAITQQERDETTRLTQDIDQQKALLAGLASKDPYVVELLARERLQYSRAGEISPPPAPSIDNLRHDGSK
jgi:cell division protein FtsB